MVKSSHVHHLASLNSKGRSNVTQLANIIQTYQTGPSVSLFREIQQIRKTNFFSKVLDFYCASNAPFDKKASNLNSGFVPPRQPPPMIAQKTKPVEQNKRNYMG